MRLRSRRRRESDAFWDAFKAAHPPLKLTNVSCGECKQFLGSDYDNHVCAPSVEEKL